MGSELDRESYSPYETKKDTPQMPNKATIRRGVVPNVSENKTMHEKNIPIGKKISTPVPPRSFNNSWNDGFENNKTNELDNKNENYVEYNGNKYNAGVGFLQLHSAKEAQFGIGSPIEVFWDQNKMKSRQSSGTSCKGTIEWKEYGCNITAKIENSALNAEDKHLFKTSDIFCIELENGTRIYLPVTHVQIPDPTSTCGDLSCPSVIGNYGPIQEYKRLLGKWHGIQGESNSCYLDSTIFAMFSFSSMFDDLLTLSKDRSRKLNNIHLTKRVQRVLKENIVNPLRSYHYVRADKMMKLREVLANLPAAKNIKLDEQDAEEFLNLLMDKALNATPYLELSTGERSFMYQLFVVSNLGKSSPPTVQEIFLQSFEESEITLKKAPKILILQMPRHGVRQKTFDRILPSKFLDITDVVDGAKDKEGKIFMNLFAVLCIETSHYISFVRCGRRPDSDWCFFDSMADRTDLGGIYDENQDGYNVPEVSEAKEVSKRFGKIKKPNLETFQQKNPFEDVEDVLSK